MSTILDAERYARQLEGTPLFNGVQTDWIRLWLNRADVKICEYEAGEYLLRKYDTADQLGILLRGSAEVRRESSDGRMHMSTLCRNDLFGAASLFSKDSAYVTDICCIHRARALLIPEKEMLELLSDNQTVLVNYLSYLNSRIRFLNNRLEAFSKNTVSARILTYLYAEAKGSVYRVSSYTRLSDSLCISRATMYRALDALEKEHKIQRIGKDIILSEVQNT